MGEQQELLLEMKSITKLFPGVKALDNVTMDVRRGEIHALVGENGAGKSTLMNILSGIYPYKSYEGSIVYEGKECQFTKIHDSETQGIVIIHQELALVPGLSIGENMFLGNEQGRAIAINWDETYRKADEYLAMVGLRESSRTLVRNISVGKQQLVEIAKALAKNVRLLILDEPTASLNEDDSQKLFSTRAVSRTCNSPIPCEVNWLPKRRIMIGRAKATTRSIGGGGGDGVSRVRRRR